MRVLFDHNEAFMLTHGGFQTQIEKSKLALEGQGIEVEWLRWWDDRQRGDLIHFFGLTNSTYLRQARSQRLPVVMTTIFTETCNRSDFRLALQGCAIRLALAVPAGRGIKQQLAWSVHAHCAANIVGLHAEKRVLERVYRVPPGQISLVPLGLSEVFLTADAGRRNEPHLICTGTITNRKNSVELAEMARTAQVPILFVGRAYDIRDPYWLRFQALIDNRWVKYHPHVSSESEMVRLLQAARGFVLMSDYENWCLSAHEAAACGLPLLVQNQKWSRERFGDQAQFFERVGNTPGNISQLRRFYEQAPSLSAPRIKLHHWNEVGRELKTVYERVLSTSR